MAFKDGTIAVRICQQTVSDKTLDLLRKSCHNNVISHICQLCSSWFSQVDYKKVFGALKYIKHKVKLLLAK